MHAVGEVLFGFLKAGDRSALVHTLSQSFYDAGILLGIGDVDSMEKPTCLMVQIKAVQNRYLLESQGQSCTQYSSNTHCRGVLI